MRNWSNKDVLTAAAQAAFLLNLSIQRKKISSSASPLSIERRPLPALNSAPVPATAPAAGSNPAGGRGKLPVWLPRTAIFLVPANFQDFQSITGGKIVKQT